MERPKFLMAIFTLIMVMWAIGIAGIVIWQSNKPANTVTTSKASGTTIVTHFPTISISPTDYVDPGRSRFGELLQGQ